MSSPELQRSFAEDIVFLRYAGLKPVVVHGGGPQITEHLTRLGIASEFRGGLRVTTPEAMTVVRMVLVGQVNGDVVNLINDHGPFAVGLSGEDGGLLTAERRPAIVDGEPVDIGQVGDVVAVDPATVHALIDAGRVPVIATVARGLDGLSYNVNADTAAASIAVAVEAEKLVVLTDVEGLYADWPASTEIISQIARGRPGDACCRRCPAEWSRRWRPACARSGAASTGRTSSTVASRMPLLLEVFTSEGVGTMVLPKEVQ